MTMPARQLSIRSVRESAISVRSASPQPDASSARLRNVLIFGRKTHLAIAIGRAAVVETGHLVLFTSATVLLAALAKAESESQLGSTSLDTCRSNDAARICSFNRSKQKRRAGRGSIPPVV
jgi:hypothetical protein